MEKNAGKIKDIYLILIKELNLQINIIKKMKKIYFFFYISPKNCL